MATKKKKSATKTAAKKSTKSAKKAVKPIPKGYHAITPHLIVRGAAKALDWYAKVFGAVPTIRMEGADGLIAHCEFKIGDCNVMMSDEFPDIGSKSPESLGGTPTGIMMYVADTDAIYARAVKAGAKGLVPPGDMFWGDRYSKLSDPFGHTWAIATHFEDVSEKEMKKRQAAMYGSMPKD